MKIPFDIKYRPQIESGEYKVETRDGKPVRIICWDRKHGYPICGLAYEKATGYENYVNAYENGLTAFHRMQEMNDDLFIVTPEPELTEFEKEYFRLYEEGYADGQAGSKKLSDEVLKESAVELLALARQQIYDDGVVELGKDARYQQGVADGKAEVLKDLPRWKPAAVAYDGDRLPRIDWMLNRLVARFEEGIFYLDIRELYKLPGFND